MFDSVNLNIRGSFSDLIADLEKSVEQRVIKRTNERLDDIISHGPKNEMIQILRQRLIIKHARGED